jgi:hypothetical protein
MLYQRVKSRKVAAHLICNTAVIRSAISCRTRNISRDRPFMIRARRAQSSFAGTGGICIATVGDDACFRSTSNRQIVFEVKVCTAMTINRERRRANRVRFATVRKRAHSCRTRHISRGQPFVIRARRAQSSFAGTGGICIATVGVDARSRRTEDRQIVFEVKVRIAITIRRAFRIGNAAFGDGARCVRARKARSGRIQMLNQRVESRKVAAHLIRHTAVRGDAILGNANDRSRIRRLVCDTGGAITTHER